MAGRRVFGINFVALAVILVLLLKFNSGEKLGDNAEAVTVTKETIDAAVRPSSLIDSNDGSGLQYEWPFIRHRKDLSVAMQSNPDVVEKAVTSNIDGEKIRKKRLVFLLPVMAPAFSSFLAALGIGTAAAAAVTVLQNGPISIPHIPLYIPSAYHPIPETQPTTAYHPIPTAQPTTAYHPIPTAQPIPNSREISKSKNKKEPKSEQVTSNPRSGAHEEIQAPKVEDMHDDFKNLEYSKPLNGRKRWRDKKTGEYYEWQGSEGGHLEKYNDRGKEHQGGFDPYTGKRVADPVPGRKIDVN